MCSTGGKAFNQKSVLSTHQQITQERNPANGVTVGKLTLLRPSSKCMKEFTQEGKPMCAQKVGRLLATSQVSIHIR